MNTLILLPCILKPIIFIILFVLFVALGIWAFASGINFGSINYIVGPLFGTVSILIEVGLLIVGLIMAIKK